MYQSLVFIAVSAVSVLVFFTFMKLRPSRMRSRPAPPTDTLTCEENGDQQGRLSVTRMEFSCEEEESHGEDKELLSVLGEN